MRCPTLPTPGYPDSLHLPGSVKSPVGPQPVPSPAPAPLATPGRAGGVYYGWVLVVMLGVTQTITWGIVYYSFSVFLPAMATDLDRSRGQMSGALSVATLLSGLCAAPVGRWLDARGPRLLMTAGLVMATLLVLA